MDPEVIQKYKEGGSNEYTVVYDAEGQDDPYGDFPVAAPVPLSNEKEIFLPGEVTQSALMENELGDLLNSYGGGGGDTTSISAYVDNRFYGSSIIEELEEAEEKEEKKEEDELYSLK
jgi:hypothetical protein